MNHYFAITTGPIYTTIKQARKIRELWASSYIFSLLMRELLNQTELRSIGNLLSPIVDNNRIRNGAGIYPDRCFFQANKLIDIEANDMIQKAIDGAIRSVSIITRIDFEFLKSYFRILAVTCHAESAESPILKLNRLLDVYELQTKIPTGGNNSRLVDKLEKQIDDLYNDGISNSEGKDKFFIKYMNNWHQQLYRLPSLLEMSTLELNALESEKYDRLLTEPTNDSIRKFQRGQDNRNKAEVDESADQEQAILRLKSKVDGFGNAFKFRHKYIAFILADGDNMGAILDAIGNDTEKIINFSTILSKFTEKAVERIIKYRGVPIYGGGDDLLFAVPLINGEQQIINGKQQIINGKQQTFLDLLDDLDLLFPAEDLNNLVSQNDQEKRPSLSFGVSIGFYKYPMAESLDAMKDLLFSNAKKHKGKNAIAFRVLKHSGQAFGVTLTKRGIAYTDTQALLKLIGTGGLDQNFLSSVMHKLSKLEKLLEDALKTNQMDAFFEYHFNEDVHKRTQTNAFLARVRSLLINSWIETNCNIKETLQCAYGLLRLVQFLNQEDHE